MSAQTGRIRAFLDLGATLDVEEVGTVIEYLGEEKRRIRLYLLSTYPDTVKLNGILIDGQEVGINDWISGTQVLPSNKLTWLEIDLSKQRYDKVAKGGNRKIGFQLLRAG